MHCKSDPDTNAVFRWHFRRFAAAAARHFSSRRLRTQPVRASSCSSPRSGFDSGNAHGVPGSPNPPPRVAANPEPRRVMRGRERQGEAT